MMEIYEKPKWGRYKVNIAFKMDIPVSRLEKYIEGADNLNHKELEKLTKVLEEFNE